MKNYFITILLFLMGSILIKAQEELATGELIIYAKNNTEGAEIKIEVQLVSSLCWDAIDDLEYYDVHDLTNQYPGSFQITNSTTTQDLNWEACWSYPGYEHAFGLGKYKVTAYQKISGEFETKDYFYIDYRTSDLPENFNSEGQGDVGVDFNVGSGLFYYKNTQDLFPTYTSIWERKTWIRRIEDYLEPLPPESFQLTSSGGHPYASWSHSANTEDYWTNYAVYRSVVPPTGGGPSTFTKIATLSKWTTSYTDFDFAVHGPMTAYYKVAAVNVTRESDFTATLGIGVGLYKNEISEKEFTYSLSQNYPNPFNPTTKIAYTLPGKEFVSISVYNTAGVKVSELVNEYMDKGKHSTELSGEYLPSGIYFYIMRAGNFTETRKFVLLK